MFCCQFMNVYLQALVEILMSSILQEWKTLDKPLLKGTPGGYPMVLEPDFSRVEIDAIEEYIPKVSNIYSTMPDTLDQYINHGSFRSSVTLILIKMGRLGD